MRDKTKKTQKREKAQQDKGKKTLKDKKQQIRDDKMQTNH